MTPTATITDTADPSTVSERVVEEVASATGTDPLDLDPLYDAIDPDALDALFDDRSLGVARHGGYVAFPMAGCMVFVYADGTIEVSDGPTTVEPANGVVEPSPPVPESSG